jgi:DnaJ-class molecular chaperone
MTMTKQQLVDENKRLKGLLDKEFSKKPCYHCNGTGRYWTYGLDDEESCPYCHGSGRM